MPGVRWPEDKGLQAVSRMRPYGQYHRTGLRHICSTRGRWAHLHGHLRRVRGNLSGDTGHSTQDVPQVIVVARATGHITLPVATPPSARYRRHLGARSADTAKAEQHPTLKRHLPLLPTPRASEWANGFHVTLDTEELVTRPGGSRWNHLRRDGPPTPTLADSRQAVPMHRLFPCPLSRRPAPWQPLGRSRSILPSLS